MHDPIATVRLQNRFRHALGRGRRRRLWRRLRGGDDHLPALDDALRGHPVLRRQPRRELVDLGTIRGSAHRHRARDFDPDFLPLSAADEERWIRVAEGIEEVGLPPVQLLRYRGDLYVEDGHHRISVFRQLGVRSLWAEVVELVEVAGAPAAIATSPPAPAAA